MTEAAWRRRFRAARLSLPSWARDEPERLLYASNASGKWELSVWDRRTTVHRQVTDRPAGTMHGELDPTGEWIWWFDDDTGNEIGRWVAEPFAAGERVAVAPDVPPAYSAGLAIARSFAILGSSTDEGSSVHLVRPGEPSRLLYTHREHAEVAGLSRDETLVCLSHSEHGDSRHPALRVIDLGGRPLAHLWDGPGRGLWAAGWSPVVGDQRLLVQHERRDLGRPLLWRAETGDVRELEVDLPGEVEAAWYPDASALLLSHDYRGRVELYRLDLASGALARIDTEPGTITQARARPDGEIWYAWTSSSTPAEIRANGRVLLSPPGERAPGGAAYSEHTVAGVHLFLAEPAAPRPHPTIFQVHGGPHAHDYDAFAPRAQAWVDHGFAVVLVNYRGSTGYGKAWRDALEGNPGLTELEDVARVHDWVVAAGIADPGRVVLAGSSWGGYIALLGLGVQPERWSLGIAGVPVADYVAAFADEMEPLKAFDRALFGGSPDEVLDAYHRRSPLTYAERLRVPVMVLAGANDPRCPIRQIDNYLARLRELGKPHEVYRYDAGHGSLVIDENIRQIEAQIAFLAKHLGTPAPL
ncbi:MAG: S9 family peptidase [Chloroflexi bacterium]|nr:S9 family peptidase [Chloroflexota bacterium]